MWRSSLFFLIFLSSTFAEVKYPFDKKVSEIEWTHEHKNISFYWAEGCNFTASVNLEVIQENKANNQLECVLNCLHTNGCTLFDFSLDTYDCTLFENHAKDLIGNILVTLEEPFEQHMCGFLGSEKEHKSEEKSQVRGNEADEYDKIGWIHEEDQYISFNWTYGCSFSVSQDLKLINQNETKSQYECALNCLHTKGCTHFGWSLDTYNCMLFENLVQDLDLDIPVTLKEPFEHVCGFLDKQNSETINWQNDDAKHVTWAKRCEYLQRVKLDELRVENRDVCAHKCILRPSCTHFVFKDFNYLCTLLFEKQVSEKDAIYVENDLVMCGFLTEPEKPDFQWNKFSDNYMGQSCSFDTTDFISKKINVLLDICIENCQDKLFCTHFNWLADNSECTLLRGDVQKNDAFYMDNTWCGLVRYQDPDEN